LALTAVVLASCAEYSADYDGNHDVITIDVRSFDEFQSGHLPGAISVPLEQLAEQIRQIAPDFGQAIAVYCRSGARSAVALTLLIEMGYTNVSDLGGVISKSLFNISIPASFRRIYRIQTFAQNLQKF